MQTTETQNPETSSPPTRALSLRRDTRGLSSVEYLILLVVIAIAGISVWKGVADSISSKASETSTSIGGI